MTVMMMKMIAQRMMMMMMMNDGGEWRLWWWTTVFMMRLLLRWWWWRTTVMETVMEDSGGVDFRGDGTFASNSRFVWFLRFGYRRRNYVGPNGLDLCMVHKESLCMITAPESNVLLFPHQTIFGLLKFTNFVLYCKFVSKIALMCGKIAKNRGVKFHHVSLRKFY